MTESGGGCKITGVGMARRRRTTTASKEIHELIQKLQAGSSRQKRAAAYRLGRARDPAATAPLAAALEDADGSVRESAIDGLQVLGSAEAQEILRAHGIAPLRGRAQSPFSCVVWWLVVTFAAGIVMMLVLLVPAYVRASIPRLLSDAIHGRALEFLAVLVVGVYPAVLGSLSLVFKPRPASDRTPFEHLLHRWGASVAPIAVVLFAVVAREPSLEVVGLRLGSSTNNGVAIWAGLLAGSGMLLVLTLIARAVARWPRLQGKMRQEPPGYQVALAMQYHGTLPRTAYLLGSMLDAAGEDLVFRGYLVLLMGHRTGVYLPWALLSVGLSVVIHLYQGTDWRTILAHIGFASVFIALVVATQNIPAPLAAHLYFNGVWALGIWRSAAGKGLSGPAGSISRLEKFAYIAYIAISVALLGSAAVWITS